ncbi:MAG: T9SS type A sorting domain-containing protein [Muribaculaceae bacterium]|nr:T9SS type A sorting domain-containing protein [Muribaculaceae bacterium]
MLKKSLLLSLMLFTAASSALAWKPLFVGHRGSYRGVANTAEAYRNGVDYYHYDGLECDVRVTSDGHYVILHDESTGSLCSTNLTVATSTLAQLKALDFKQTRGGVTYTGKICTVEEYLDICVEKNVFPVIELKWTTGINNNDMKNFPGLMALVEKKGLRSKAVFLTSMLTSLKYVKNNYPDVNCQYLMTSDSDAKHQACADYNLNPSFDTSLTEEIAVRYRQEGREVAVWTVNTEANYKKFGKMGCYMMTCDYLMPSQMPELDEVVIPEPLPDPVELDNVVLWSRTMKDNNLPVDYPDAEGATYKTGQQPAVIDGKFYVNDYGTKSLVVIDRDCEAATILPHSDTQLGGSPVHGITTDDAGNIVQRYEATFSEGPNKVRVFKAGTTTDPVIINFALKTDYAKQQNFVFASGDLLSEEGGYLYFLTNTTKVICLVHIVNGKAVEVIERPGSVQGTTASVIIPIDNNPDHFIYMVRSGGFYLWDKEDKGLLLGGTSATAPSRNTSLGGAYMVIGGHEILAYPSGGNYNGGFSLIDITAGNKVLATFPTIGTGGYKKNISTGTFMNAVKIKDNVYHLYNYTMGNGYGVYEIKLKGESSIEEIADVTAEKPVVLVGDGVITVSANTQLGSVEIYSVMGAKVMQTATAENTTEISTAALPKGIYIINVNGMKPVKVAL